MPALPRAQLPRRPPPRLGAGPAHQPPGASSQTTPGRLVPRTGGWVAALSMNPPACLPRISDPQNVRAVGAGPGEADPTACGLALGFQGKTEARSGAWAVPVTLLSLLWGTVLTPADFLLGRDWVGPSPGVGRLSQHVPPPEGGVHFSLGQLCRARN